MSVRIHPTTDGYVHIGIDESDGYIMSWMDAMRMGHSLQAMSAAAAHLVGAEYATLAKLSEESWIDAETAARNAWESLHHD